MNIGKAIKELRRKRNLSQFDLAQQSGLTQTALSQIENGNRRPNVESMKKLTDYFKIPEIVIYLLATDTSDIPEEKQELYETVFPSVKTMLLSIFE